MVGTHGCMGSSAGEASAVQLGYEQAAKRDSIISLRSCMSD